MRVCSLRRTCSLSINDYRIMKTSIYTILMIVCFSALFSCGNANSSNSADKFHPFAGTFMTDNGVRFELRDDSTTFIRFSDSVTYESTWKICRSADNLEYANIEFAGNQSFYYLKDEKLYRSEREMRHDAMGVGVKYQ